MFGHPYKILNGYHTRFRMNIINGGETKGKKEEDRIPSLT